MRLSKVCYHCWLRVHRCPPRVQGFCCSARQKAVQCNRPASPPSAVHQHGASRSATATRCSWLSYAQPCMGLRLSHKHPPISGASSRSATSTRCSWLSSAGPNCTALPPASMRHRRMSWEVRKAAVFAVSIRGGRLWLRGPWLHPTNAMQLARLSDAGPLTRAGSRLPQSWLQAHSTHHVLLTAKGLHSESTQKQQW